jgi:hypothetical protein
MKGPPPGALCSRLSARLRLAPFCLHCHLCAYRCSSPVDLCTYCPREGCRLLACAPFILVHTSSRIRRLLACTGTCPALRACSVAPCTPTPWVPCGVRLCVMCMPERSAGRRRPRRPCAWYRIRYSHALFISLSYYRAKPCTAMPPERVRRLRRVPRLVTQLARPSPRVRGGHSRYAYFKLVIARGKIWKIQL